MKARIVCRGFGSAHGYANGRHWFACSACRWNTNPPGVKADPSPVLLPPLAPANKGAR